jgi:formylglycine-generating enzyme required for sulfatase activity
LNFAVIVKTQFQLITANRGVKAMKNSLKIFMVAVLCFVIAISFIACGGGDDSPTNTAPTANAGPDQSVATGSLVTLDGSGSTDANGDTLTYSWVFISTPSGSSATLSFSNIVNPSFSADIDGSYILSLFVNDGNVNSAADTVTVTATVFPGPDVLIPTGCFDMGDAFSEGDADELPVHNVCITGFYMDVHEVTNAEYKACVDAGSCTAPSNSTSSTRGTYYGNATYDNFPVIFVDWNQATDYCTWAGKRLPTEAEWEYAARGGLSGKRYPWGDTISGTDANYRDSGDAWDNDTSQVEYYAPNGYGLYDMSGNVNEWLNDWYDAGYYSVSPANDPQGTASGTLRVFRSGSWLSSVFNLRASSRIMVNPDYSGHNVGFRCASAP